MRVRTYFLIAGAVPLCLVAAFVAWVTFVSDFIWNRERPLIGQHFPPISRWDTLKITLDRTFCLGSCPDYTIEISGDGAVHYTGRFEVAIFGQHRSHISPKAVQSLFRKFEKAEFFSTFEFYGPAVMDAPGTKVSIAFDGHRKSIAHMGRADNEPSEIAELEREIDAVSGSALWVKGEGDVTAALESEHWNFHAAGRENDKIYESAMKRGDKALLRKFAGPEGPPLTPEQLMFMPLKLR